MPIDATRLRVRPARGYPSQLLRRAAFGAVGLASLEMPAQHLLRDPKGFLLDLKGAATFSFITARALVGSAQFCAEHSFADALADPDLVERVVEYLLWWGSLDNPVLTASPVLFDSASTGYGAGIDAFRLTGTGRYLLPAAAFEHLHFAAEPVLLDALFNSQEEADTTLSLWTPGSNDLWADFEHARATARAL